MHTERRNRIDTVLAIFFDTREITPRDWAFGFLALPLVLLLMAINVWLAVVWQAFLTGVLVGDYRKDV